MTALALALQASEGTLRFVAASSACCLPLFWWAQASLRRLHGPGFRLWTAGPALSALPALAAEYTGVPAELSLLAGAAAVPCLVPRWRARGEPIRPAVEAGVNWQPLGHRSLAMRTLITRRDSLLAALAAAPWLASASEAADPWQAVRALVGDWVGESSGRSGDARVERSYRWVLQGRFLQEQSVSVYPPQERNPKGERHEHWGLFSYDKAGRCLVLRQFPCRGLRQHLPPGAGGRAAAGVRQRVV